MKVITIYVLDQELQADAIPIAELVADALHAAHGPLENGMLRTVVAVGEIEEPEDEQAFVKFVGQVATRLILVGAEEEE